MLLKFSSVSSVAQLYQTLCNPMDCCTPGLPVHHQLPELALTHVHWVRDAIQPSHPLSSPSPPPSIFPSISVFCNESVRHIRWPQYWSFSFSISPSSVAATATAKSLQSCPTLCDPIDGSPPGSPPHSFWVTWLPRRGNSGLIIFFNFNFLKYSWFTMLC